MNFCKENSMFFFAKLVVYYTTKVKNCSININFLINLRMYAVRNKFVSHNLLI